MIYDFTQTYPCNMNITLSFGLLNEQIMKKRQEVKSQRNKKRKLKEKALTELSIRAFFAS